MEPDASELRRVDRQFRDKAADLLRSDSHDFDHKLKVFVRFVQDDPVVSDICQPYLERTVDLEDWLSKLGWRSGLVLPLDDEDRLALILQLLIAIAEDRADVLNVAHAVCYETKYNDLIRSFNDKFTRLAVRDIGEKLRGMIPAEPMNGATVITTGAGSTNLVAVGQHITQTATVNTGDLSEVISTMRDLIVVQSELPPSQKAELSDDLDILERESHRTVPRTEIIMTVLQSLATLPQLVELVARAAQLLNIHF